MDNDEIQHLVDGRISFELKYACLHWAKHLCSAEKGGNLSGVSALLERFCFTHVLHWLEVLSLIGHLDVGYMALNDAVRFAVGVFTRT